MTILPLYRVVNLTVVGPGYTEDEGDPETGKPYLRLTFLDGLIVQITAPLADVIGGVARSALERVEGRPS